MNEPNTLDYIQAWGTIAAIITSAIIAVFVPLFLRRLESTKYWYEVVHLLDTVYHMLAAVNKPYYQGWNIHVKEIGFTRCSIICSRLSNYNFSSVNKNKVYPLFMGMVTNLDGILLVLNIEAQKDQRDRYGEDFTTRIKGFSELLDAERRKIAKALGVPHDFQGVPEDL
jgi:hypothetical protein